MTLKLLAFSPIFAQFCVCQWLLWQPVTIATKLFCYLLQSLRSLVQHTKVWSCQGQNSNVYRQPSESYQVYLVLCCTISLISRFWCFSQNHKIWIFQATDLNFACILLFDIWYRYCLGNYLKKYICFSGYYFYFLKKSCFCGKKRCFFSIFQSFSDYGTSHDPIFEIFGISQKAYVIFQTLSPYKRNNKNISNIFTLSVVRSLERWAKMTYLFLKIGYHGNQNLNFLKIFPNFEYLSQRLIFPTVWLKLDLFSKFTHGGCHIWP